MNKQKFTKNFYTTPGLGLLSAAPEDLFSDLDSHLADVRQRIEEEELRLQRLEPLVDSIQEAQLKEQLPLRQEIDRFRNYIDPLWAASVGFATTVFQHAGIEHEEWPEVSAETNVADATGWFTERAHEFGDGITSLQNTAINAALAVQKTDLDSKAESNQQAALGAQKKRLEYEASQAQKAAIDAALAAQKQQLESTANAATKAALATQENLLRIEAETAVSSVANAATQKEREWWDTWRNSYRQRKEDEKLAALEEQSTQHKKYLAELHTQLDSEKKAHGQLKTELNGLTTQYKTDLAELQSQLDCEKKAHGQLKTGIEADSEYHLQEAEFLAKAVQRRVHLEYQLNTVLRERDDAREANKDLDARVLNLSTHNKRATAEADAANDQAIELVSRVCNDLHITMADHNSASWAELWKDVSNDLHDQIQSAHEAQRTLQTETLEAAEQFAQAVFDAQGISHRWPKLEPDDLTSIKTWFACRGYFFEHAAKRDQIARESKILENLHRFALVSTGGKRLPLKLLVGCDLSALERWFGDRTSEVLERLCSLEEELNFAICLAVYSFRLQDRISARCAEQMEHTDMLRDRLRILARRYQDLLLAQRN